MSETNINEAVNKPEIGKKGGQEFSVVRSIRTFLEQMSEGSARPASTVVKELLQNADDAGATEIEITIDLRTLTAEGSQYDSILGPSILIRNNAMFKVKEELANRDKGDFEALLDVAGGHKTSDSVAAGRFGIGFNSVYFLSDNPIIFSRDEIHFFDLLHLLPFNNANGWIFRLEDFPAGAQKSVGQIKRIIELCFPKVILQQDTIGEMARKQEMYRQSAFRLPIRIQNRGSDAVFNTVYSLERVRSIFEEMVVEASKSILFLKSIQKVIFSELETTDSKNMVAEISITPNSSEFDIFLEHLQHKKDHTSEGIKRNISITCNGETNVLPFTVWHKVSYSNLALTEIRKRLEGSDKAIPWVSVAVPGSKDAMMLDGNGNPNWRVFLPLLEEGPCGCIFSGAFFVGPSRQRLDYKIDSGILKTEWNQALAREALVPLFCDVSIEIPEKAKDILSVDPKSYLGLFPGKMKSKEAKNLSDFIQSSFQTTEKVWFVRVPDLWGKDIDIWKGSQEFTIEKVPEWLFRYKKCYEELSKPQRRFVSESLGRALSDRADVQEFSTDIIEAVLRDKDAIDVNDLDKLWGKYAKNEDTLSTESLIGLCAFTDYSSGDIIAYDADKLYIINKDDSRIPHYNLLKGLKASFKDVIWINDVGLAKVFKSVLDIQNILKPSEETVLELLRRIDDSNPGTIVVKSSELESLIDFLIMCKTSELIDLKLSFLLKIAANKERFINRGTIFLRTSNPTKDDEAFWQICFRTHFSELESFCAKQIIRLLDKHPHCIKMLSTDKYQVVEASSTDSINVLERAFTKEESIIEELAEAINSAKDKKMARRVSEYLLGQANLLWEDWDDTRKDLILKLPIHRAVDGKYVSLQPDQSYWLQSKDDIKDAPITLEDRIILNPLSQTINEYYNSMLGIDYYGRLPVIKELLSQVGTSAEIDNHALLAYVLKYFKDVLDEYPQDSDTLKSLLKKATICPCIDNKWCLISEIFNPDRMIYNLIDQGWTRKEAITIVKNVCRNIPILDDSFINKMVPFVNELQMDISILSQAQFLKSLVGSEDLSLSISQVLRLLSDNRNNDEISISEWINQQQIPTITGIAKMCDAELCTWSAKLPEAIVYKIIPNAVDITKLINDRNPKENQIIAVLEYLKVRRISKTEFNQRFVSDFQELWKIAKTKDQKQDTLNYIEVNEIYEDLSILFQEMPVIQTMAGSDSWATPKDVLSPSIAALNPPLIPKSEYPVNDNSQAIVQLYNRICGINSLNSLLERILECNNHTSGHKQVEQVYTWLSSLLEDSKIAELELTDCLKAHAWVLCTCAEIEKFLAPHEVLLSEAVEILGHCYFLPSVDIPNNLRKLDLGFQRTIPETKEDLMKVCKAISCSEDAKNDSFLALYRMLAKLISDDDLKETWLAESKENPLFFSFRDTTRFCSSSGLFIGNEKYDDDISENLLCLNKSELPNGISKLYEKLGLSVEPETGHLLFALSEFKVDGNVKDYQRLVDTLIGFSKQENLEWDKSLGKLKALTVAGTYKELNNCFWDAGLVGFGNIEVGSDFLIDLNDRATKKLIDWIHDVEPYYPKSLRNSLHFNVDYEEGDSKLAHCDSVLDPWYQFLADLDNDDSSVFEKIKDLIPSLQARLINLIPVNRATLRSVDEALALVIINSTDENWFCISQSDHDILVKPAQCADYHSIDKLFASELIRTLGIEPKFTEEDDAINEVVDCLERPSALLRKISKDKRESLLILYKNEVADPIFNDKYETYEKTSKRKRLSLESELLAIVSENYLSERRKSIIGHGYDKHSIIAELLQNAEDAYKQASSLGMEMPESPYFRISYSDEFEQKELSVEYQGRPFNYYKYNGQVNISFKQDVEGLLRSSGSFKPHANPVEDAPNTAIGKFGLGFKSVYLITENPVIHSGHWHFRIDNGCLPVEIGAPEGWSPRLTRIELPLSYNDDNGKIEIESVWRLLPFLTQIANIELDENNTSHSIVRSEDLIGSESSKNFRYCQIIVDGIPVCRFYKIQSNHAQLAMMVDEKGLPMRWLPEHGYDCYAYLPLQSRLGFGIAISNQFSIQSGRTHLLNDNENISRSDEIKQLVLPFIKALKQLIAEDTAFWSGFWDVFKLEPGNSETSHIKKDLAESLIDAMKSLSIIPTLSGLACLRDQKNLFYFSDTILTSIRDSVMKAGIRIENKAITYDNTVDLDTVARIKAIFKQAGSEEDTSEIFVKVDVDTLISEFTENPILAEHPEILNAIADQDSSDHWHFHSKWLSDCLISGKSVNDYELPCNLYTNDIPDIAYLPNSKLKSVSFSYTDCAIIELQNAGLKSCPDEDEIDEWITKRSLTYDECIDIMRYLHIDSRYASFINLRDAINTAWIPFNNGYISPKQVNESSSKLEFILADFVYCSWLGIYTAPQPETGSQYKYQPLDTPAVLSRIYTWWQRVKDEKVLEYNRIAYPDGSGLNISRDEGLETESKSEWMKLFMLGSLHAMGRTKIEQHRGFLSLCLKADLLNMNVSTQEREKKWFESILEFLDDPNDNQQFYHWVGFTSLRFLQFNRWLDDYMMMFTDIDKRQKPINIGLILTPRSNPDYSGTGIEPPSLVRAFGRVGVHFVLRELVRHNAINGASIHEQCFVPSRKITDLFQYISNGSTFESSEEIADFLFKNLPGKDMTFGKCFDIPFQMLIRDQDLLQELVHDKVVIELREDDYDI